ncbi:DUF2989 domain-containing protein [Vibrio fluvialis]|uniref:DUF2989 domain-containing protein n=1 Tax=Vibrio fluvialis TaxID=676 RepID=UPI000357773E|nr:DUF2989 domain-containing protein [Vibrio fluvialis]EPP24755.1 hypothetical protein L911_1379 [Vibrio fluvialis I21563]MBL4239193.1 DUF2989 domain-containing protein [Vibrio fluvialis]MBL4260118.1 DUF2989 domain-containing protein [Vibrio fluvialis]MBL4265667.1 DUF2989 domain-containing protein [Vibrio fluvialis]MBL4270681.1 DUF2989 domain-containing protein [Vibrio fluvialis]
MNSVKTLVILSLPLLLSGCFENRKNTEKLCADNPNLRCEHLNMDDGQCRIPRTDLIWHRYEVLKNPSVDNKIQEYSFVSAYRKCLELASQIQPIDQSALKERRFDALIHTGKEQERLVSELRQMRTPHSLYFLWSQTGDNQARREFLQMEGKPELESAELQYALATFYTSRDREKTIRLLNHALELSNGQTVNIEIFKSLASTYQALNDKEHAYVWAMVGKSFGVPLATPAELELLYGFSQDKFKRLEGLADEVIKAINTGQFSSHMIPNILE